MNSCYCSAMYSCCQQLMHSELFCFYSGWNRNDELEDVKTLHSSERNGLDLVITFCGFVTMGNHLIVIWSTEASICRFKQFAAPVVVPKKALAARMHSAETPAAFYATQGPDTGQQPAVDQHCPSVSVCAFRIVCVYTSHATCWPFLWLNNLLLF